METIELTCSMKGKGICPLPLENLLDIVRQKWSLSLLITIGNFDNLHFNALRKKIRDHDTKRITSKILSSRLKKLVEAGLIKREKYVNPFTVKYSLTREGKGFYKIFLTIGSFNEKGKKTN